LDDAVGFYSGNVAIYDVRNPRDLEPMVKSSFATGKHSDPVWKVQWVDHAAENGESLVSISTDGRVSQWSIKKVRLQRKNTEVQLVTEVNEHKHLP